MAKMRELRDLSEKDTATRLTELRLELSKERAASEIGTAKNPGRIGAVRREIARILTIKREKELGIAKAKKPAPATKPKEAAKGKEKKAEKPKKASKAAPSSPSPPAKPEKKTEVKT